MGLVSKPNTFTAGNTVIASQHNSNFDTLYNLVNGSLNTANLSGSANIVDTQLAQITTAAKVSTTALTIASQATGDLIYAGSSSTWSRLGIGTASQVLIGGTTPSWATVPTTSGSIIQSKITQSSAFAQSTGTAIDDDTIPQLSECPVIAAYNTAITASSASNTFIITLCFNISVDATNNTRIIAIFLDGATNASAATRWIPNGSTADSPAPCMIQFSISPADTASHTYKVGMGGVSGSVATINGVSGARKLGGVLFSSLRIDEVKA